MARTTTDRPNVLFVMTIDTEEGWEWGKGFPVQTYSVDNAQNIPKFQEFCQQFGIRPTYFIDYAIASDPAGMAHFTTYFHRNECEIGAHLHSWVTPPLEERMCEPNTHAINLPLELVRRKLTALTDKLSQEFGAPPKTFRSGRWGMNGALLQLLHELGYHTDSSVFPFYADAPFSYYDAPDVPYWPDLTTCARPGTQRRIFEIPVTSGFNRHHFALAHAVHQFLARPPWSVWHSIGILWHARLLRKIPLSPELAEASDMIALIRACLRRGHRIIHMFFHSSSLLPGGTPYVVTEHDERRFYHKMAQVITYLIENTDVTFCTLSEAKQRYLMEEHA